MTAAAGTVAASVVLAALTVLWGAWALERLGDWVRGGGADDGEHAAD